MLKASSLLLSFVKYPICTRTDRSPVRNDTKLNKRTDMFDNDGLIYIVITLVVLGGIVVNLTVSTELAAPLPA